jgi:hypothetical protein
MVRLIPDWKRAHKFLSVQLTALNGAAVAAWASVPDDWRAAIPHPLVIGAGIFMFVATIVVRMIDQTPAEDRKP